MPRRGLTPEFPLAVHLSAICSRNRYTVDAAPVLAELFQVAGDRLDVLPREWSESNWAMDPIYLHSAKGIRENATAITRAVGELWLIVGDEELLTRITAANAALSERASLLALIDEAKRAKTGKPEKGALGDTRTHYGKVREAFRSVEARAAELLRGELRAGLRGQALGRLSKPSHVLSRRATPYLWPWWRPQHSAFGRFAFRLSLSARSSSTRRQVAQAPFRRPPRSAAPPSLRTADVTVL